MPALYALLGPESEGFGNWSDATELADRGRLGLRAHDVPRRRRSTSPAPARSRGTYDTFVEFAIADLAEERGADEATRADYSSSPNDNLIVEGIESSESSLGWVGYAFYVAEQERMKAIEIDGGDGCVAPTPETIADGSYPFSRSLYIYVNTANAEENPAVASFVDLYLSTRGSAVGDRRRLRRPARRPRSRRRRTPGPAADRHRDP